MNVQELIDKLQTLERYLEVKVEDERGNDLGFLLDVEADNSGRRKVLLIAYKD